MSVKLMAAAWDLDIPSTEKMVLMCLCDFANDDGGNCWPSIATISRKCSKSERTVQSAVKWLEDNGYLETCDQVGKRRDYLLDPRKICAPAKSAPPQKKTQTPAKSAPKPPRTTIKQTQRAHVLPDDWKPEPFGSGSKSKAVVDGWTPDDLATQIEHFTSHHRGKGNRFIDWQDAWGTWVLNSRRFNPQRRAPPASNDQGGGMAAAILAKRR